MCFYGGIQVLELGIRGGDHSTLAALGTHVSVTLIVSAIDVDG